MLVNSEPDVMAFRKGESYAPPPPPPQGAGPRMRKQEWWHWVIDLGRVICVPPHRCTWMSLVQSPGNTTNKAPF